MCRKLYSTPVLCLLAAAAIAIWSSILVPNRLAHQLTFEKFLAAAPMPSFEQLLAAQPEPATTPTPRPTAVEILGFNPPTPHGIRESLPQLPPETPQYPQTPEERRRIFFAEQAAREYAHRLHLKAGPTALCADASYSYSPSRRRACSYHGGVHLWLRSPH